VVIGVGEADGAADRDVGRWRDALDGRPAAAPPIPVLRADPQLTGRERGAGQDHEFHEVAALDVDVLGPVNREVLPPGRLRGRRRIIGRKRDLLAVDSRSVGRLVDEQQQQQQQQQQRRALEMPVHTSASRAQRVEHAL
jgi:hypothetical protein